MNKHSNVQMLSFRTALFVFFKIFLLKDELHPGSKGRPYAEQITFVNDRPGHDLRYAIDARKIKRELQWEPLENFETGFRKTVQWYLDNEEWWTDILSGDYQLDRQGTVKR